MSQFDVKLRHDPTGPFPKVRELHSVVRDHDADDPLPPFFAELLNTLCARVGAEEREIITRTIDALRKLDERDPYAARILLEWFKSRDRETKPHLD